MAVIHTASRIQNRMRKNRQNNMWICILYRSDRDVKLCVFSIWILCRPRNVHHWKAYVNVLLQWSTCFIENKKKLFQMFIRNTFGLLHSSASHTKSQKGKISECHQNRIKTYREKWKNGHSYHVSHNLWMMVVATSYTTIQYEVHKTHWKRREKAIWNIKSYFLNTHHSH